MGFKNIAKLLNKAKQVYEIKEIQLNESFSNIKKDINIDIPKNTNREDLNYENNYNNNDNNKKIYNNNWEEDLSLLKGAVSNLQQTQTLANNLNITNNNFMKGGMINDIITPEIEKNTHDLSKIPDNLINEVKTDWEPLNYLDVHEEYPLYKNSKVTIEFDEKTQKVLYKISEPELTEKEEEILKELKRAFIFVFENITYDTKDINHKNIVVEATSKLIKKYRIKLTEEQFDKVTYYLERDFIGLEILEPIMHDKFIEDVSCDGLGVPIFVNHLKYGPLEVNRTFIKEDNLNSFIIKLAQKSNQEVSMSKPILQGALTDGSRVEAIYGKEVSGKGSSFTIRKFREEPFTPIHLIEFGTMTTFLLSYLWLAVENKQSILVSGGTATGKTTMLNALSLFVHPSSKIVSIEDTPEINLPHEHWLPLISRENDGKSDVSMFDLLKASLRERPDYIIVGEIRGAEAAILFQGMATGHAGMGTVHAEKFADLINRMTIDPINLPKPLITELDICIFVKRTKVQKNIVRRISSVVEVEGYDSKTDTFTSNEFMKYSPVDDTFEFSEKSFVISHLLELRGGEESSLWTEIEKRRRLLEAMHKKRIFEFQDVINIFQQYYKATGDIFEFVNNYKIKEK